MFRGLLTLTYIKSGEVISTTVDPKIKSEAKPVLAGIQLLRGCAAVLVVLAHDNLMMVFPRYFQQSPFPIREAGVFGVCIFFVISGFIIAYVSLGRDLNPKFPILDFARRRFLRIMPFLWLSVIGYNLLSFAGTREMEWMSALRAMVIWPVGDLKPNVIWSLRHELLFYFLFALTLMGARRRLWLLGSWFAAPLVFGLLFGAHHRAADPFHSALAELYDVVIMGGQTGANLQFCMGFLLGALRLRNSQLTAPWLPGGLFITLLTLVAATVLVEALAIPSGLGRNVLWTLLATIIVWLGLISQSSNGWVQKVGVLLGDASFAIYLIHNGVLLVLFEATRSLRHSAPLWLLFVVIALIAIGVGVLAHLFIEAPLIQWLAHGRRIVPWQTEDRRAKESTKA